jgi:hypothetical protein
MPLKVYPLLLSVLSQRVVPRAQTIFIRIPTHPVRARIPRGIGLKISNQKAVGLASRYPVTRHDTLPASPKQALGDALQLMCRRCVVVADPPAHVGQISRISCLHFLLVRMRDSHHSATGSEGLQMLVPPRPGGEWLDIPTVEGALVVQLGAIMQRWTADVWRATPHRVLCPPAGVVSDRLTLGFFFRPNCDTTLSLPQSSAIRCAVDNNKCESTSGSSKSGAQTAAVQRVEIVDYDQVSTAQFIALPKAERLSTTVTPEGAYICTPLSAQRVTTPA